MNNLPPCPLCKAEYTYKDNVFCVCPSCFHEWSDDSGSNAKIPEERIYKDANGNALLDDDTIIVIKDLKIKGSSLVVKVGTKIKNIRLVDEDLTLIVNSMALGQ